MPNAWPPKATAPIRRVKKNVRAIVSPGEYLAPGEYTGGYMGARAKFAAGVFTGG
jgi:hypothetical protein